MNEIFVPYEIETKLKEIGFDEPCVAYYGAEINTTYPFNFQYKPVLISIIPPSESAIPAPTWEQVFKWFRERGIMGYVKPFALTEKYNFVIGDRVYFDVVKSFEQARELLILEMIEIYENR